MATLDRSFVDGVFRRILVLAAFVAAATALVISFRFGYSVALGALVSAASLRVTTVAVERLVRGALEEKKRRSALWSAALAVKMLALLLVVVIALAVLDAHAVAFVLGFKLIFPALLWQAIRSPDSSEESDDDVNDQESS